MSTVLVHDTRLAGPTPSSLADLSFEVDGTVPISGMVQQILTVGQSISRLLIMCHGYESTSNGSASIPMTLGFGLQLCLESLTLANGSVMNGLNGAVESIILYACGPANTTPYTMGTAGDGRRFCSEMAAYTNADVYASDTSQSYHNASYDATKKVCESIPIDFGNWEGNVYLFKSDGTVTVVEANPVPAN